MGSSDWFKTKFNLKKGKNGSSKQDKGSLAPEKSNGSKGKQNSRKESRNTSNVNESSSGNPCSVDLPVEDVAAIRIQMAFRAHMARKALRRLKGIVRLQTLILGHSAKRQASSTLNHLHSWSRIQDQIKARRLCMVTEGRIRQKKLENQLKLEAKLHDVEQFRTLTDLLWVEWSGGSETIDEILGRIHQREEAAGKRERAMAYAFSHQWRANSSQNLFICSSSELGEANWGWSWMERWIAARPWERRVSAHASPKKAPSKLKSKANGSTHISPSKTPVSTKSVLSNRTGGNKARRYSYPAAEKPSAQKSKQS